MVAPVLAQIPKFPSSFTRRKHSNQVSPLLAVADVICITWRHYLSRSQQLAHTSRHHGMYPSTRSFQDLFAPVNPLRDASSVLSYSCGLFVVHKKVKPFAIKHIRTLCANTGVGVVVNSEGWKCVLRNGMVRSRSGMRLGNSG
jgi:galactose-1-phosphate uridylyltransferase